MSKVAIFISDMHLGSGDELESFVPENENAFVKFLQCESDKFFGRELDLVILGDFLDIWQVAPWKEKHAEETKDIDLSFTIAIEIERSQNIVSAHLKTFRALRRFLVADPTKRRIVCIPGNHDHSLVDPLVQKVVSDAIVDGNPSLKGRVVFPLWYDEPELLTYAEHGSQYDDNNQYEHFQKFGNESPGYFFVRLFFNRLKSIQPNVDGVWNRFFEALWEERRWYLIETAWKYYRQYSEDSRVVKKISILSEILLAEAPGVEVTRTGKLLPEFPDVLFSDRPYGERIFAKDDATENRLRKLYHDPSSKGFKAEVDKILEQKFEGHPPAVPDKSIAAVAYLGLEEAPYDTYLIVAEGMFAPDGEPPRTMPLKGSALNIDTYRYVLLGHTHEHESADILNRGAKYFNTGCWAVQRNAAGKNESSLCFVIVQKTEEGKVEPLMDIWPLTLSA